MLIYLERERERRGDAPKPDSYSANSLLFNSSNSICSVNFGLPALLSAASSAIRGSFLVMNTSSMRALSEGSERGLGDDMACRKKIGRNTATSAGHRDWWEMKLHLLEASSLRALAAPLSLCSRRLTRISWSAVCQLESWATGFISLPFLEPGCTPSFPLIVFLVNLLFGIV
jgi:hypothetical protein